MADAAIFEKAHAFVQKWEGGLSDDPDDRGGITKYGVSLKFLRSVRGESVTPDDIRALTKTDAKALFYDHFWRAARCFMFDDAIATVLYDCAVNCGVSRAVKLLQKAVGTKEDGIIGGKTLGAVRLQADYQLALKHIEAREDFYRGLAERNPTQKKFLRGWLNRTADLRQHIAAYRMD